MFQEIGNVETWSKAIEKDITIVSRTLEEAHRGGLSEHYIYQHNNCREIWNIKRTRRRGLAVMKQMYSFYSAPLSVCRSHSEVGAFFPTFPVGSSRAPSTLRYQSVAVNNIDQINISRRVTLRLSISSIFLRKF